MYHYSTRGDKVIKKRRQVKLEVLSYYSEGNQCKCVRCGFGDIRALSIDHIEGGGNRHRESIKTRNIYTWLKDNNYPKGYQTLCMNCQFIKRAEMREENVTNQEKLQRIGIY